LQRGKRENQFIAVGLVKPHEFNQAKYRAAENAVGFDAGGILEGR